MKVGSILGDSKDKIVLLRLINMSLLRVRP
jgi:hypothetical protein